MGRFMLKLITKTDLDALYNGGIKEGIRLEYKASPAIDKRDDNKKIELARDVSAFANADGGQIIYGMVEKDHGGARRGPGSEGLSGDLV
jgi:predicted HTH transcriptional regulator